MNELEDVVAQLDSEVKLECALVLFERGMKLSRDLEIVLKGAEERIEILKKGEGGALIAVPINQERATHKRPDKSSKNAVDCQSGALSQLSLTDNFSTT
jgi:exodeoxyribonuclease VII small subunit